MFKGVITPMITVLDKERKIDYEGNRLVIERLIENGMNGILFLGSMGEFFALTTEEKQAFIRFAVKAVNGRVPVLVGTGGTILKEVVDLTNFAQREGADGAVVVSPYYLKLDNDTLYRFYASVARATTLPIMLYNFPDRTSVSLEPELVLKLALEFSNIVAIKDTVDTISHTRRLIQVVKGGRPEFCVLSGIDEYLLPNLTAGGDGVLCGLTNVVPAVFSGLLKAFREKDFDGVLAAQRKISLLMNIYDVSSSFIASVKGAVAARGLPIGAYVKEPSGGLSATQIEKIAAFLSAADRM